MQKQNKFIIAATYAKDKILDEQGKVIIEQKGGPAYFIERIFRLENQRYDIISTPEVTVEILVTPDGEFGKILQKPQSLDITYQTLNSDALLISTLLDEVVLRGFSQYKGKIFLDIQGYVRNGNDFGKKKKWLPSSEITKSIFCMKGTAEEVSMVPTDIVELQKKNVLLITKGSEGSELYAFDKRYVIKPTQKIDPKNTIGAGDTFFAYFTIAMIQTSNALQSARSAAQKTSDFLVGKSND